jgi:hypothetical protein
MQVGLEVSAMLQPPHPPPCVYRSVTTYIDFSDHCGSVALPNG